MSEKLEAPVLSPEARPRNANKVVRGVAIILMLAGVSSAAHKESRVDNPRVTVTPASASSAPTPQSRGHFFEDKYLAKKFANEQALELERTAAEIARFKHIKEEADIKRWNTAVFLQAAARQEELGKIPYNDAMWERLHNCEQPGNWYANGGNPNDPAGQTFQGGLGMSTVAWDIGVKAAAERGVSLPDSALDATIQEQKVGAQAFYDETNGGGWACPVG